MNDTPKGIKHDAGKPDYTLLPWDALEEVVGVLEGGIKKYARDNWQIVPGGRQRYIKGAFRHLIASMFGPSTDPDFGRSHLAHAICCLLFALWFDLNPGKEISEDAGSYLKPGVDDTLGQEMLKAVAGCKTDKALRELMKCAAGAGDVLLGIYTLTDQGKRRLYDIAWSALGNPRK